jgi:hypothetical protein
MWIRRSTEDLSHAYERARRRAASLRQFAGMAVVVAVIAFVVLEAFQAPTAAARFYGFPWASWATVRECMGATIVASALCGLVVAFSQRFAAIRNLESQKAVWLERGQPGSVAVICPRCRTPDFGGGLPCTCGVPLESLSMWKHVDDASDSN